MRYLISDIHGDLILFKKMLREINFNFEYDELIIVGDILDRNEHGIKLYQFIKYPLLPAPYASTAWFFPVLWR